MSYSRGSNVRPTAACDILGKLFAQHLLHRRALWQFRPLLPELACASVAIARKLCASLLNETERTSQVSTAASSARPQKPATNYLAKAADLPDSASHYLKDKGQELKPDTVCRLTGAKLIEHRADLVASWPEARRLAYHRTCQALPGIVEPWAVAAGHFGCLPCKSLSCAENFGGTAPAGQRLRIFS